MVRVILVEGVLFRIIKADPGIDPRIVTIQQILLPVFRFEAGDFRLSFPKGSEQLIWTANFRLYDENGHVGSVINCVNLTDHRP